MKIIKQIRDIYGDAWPLYSQVSNEVAAIVSPKVNENDWFFISRIKDIESFAQKIETGRVYNPARMEDFYAATIVVATSREIVIATEMIDNEFEIVRRRPSDDSVTHKTPATFDFDDLRLYVKMKSTTMERYPRLIDVVFEIQIKTILQHAWSLATHQLIYKSTTVNWPLERIAFQIKAMLEHAEVAIAEANILAETSSIAKSDKKTVAKTELLSYIQNTWNTERLPGNLRRLADSILEVLQLCGLSVDDFPGLISNEQCRIGTLPIDLSPYSFTVQALANSSKVNLKKVLRTNKGRTVIVIHRGMELPDWMSQSHRRILNLG